MSYGLTPGAAPKLPVMQTCSPRLRRSHPSIPGPYTAIGLLGQGAYGEVWSAIQHDSRDDSTRPSIAVKIVRPFQSSTMALRTIREIRVLRNFRHENIVSIRGVLVDPICSSTSKLYIIQECMEIDLDKVIRTQILTNEHCSYFTWQILCGLKALHSAGVMHRDLKPANILLNRDCDLKICDFGLARADGPQDATDKFKTEYVATRWYRAPEVMIRRKRYTKSIDLWATGCIVAEMLGGKPLFRGGPDPLHQLACIFGIIGTPQIEDIAILESRHTRTYLMNLPPQSKVSWNVIWERADPPRLPLAPFALDLLDKLLQFNPQKRLTAEEALEHPYLRLHHDVEDEPTADPIGADIADLDNAKHDIFKLQKLLLRELTPPDIPPRSVARPLLPSQALNQEP